MDITACFLAQLGLRRDEYFVASATNVDTRPEFQETLGRCFAQTRTATCNQDAFILKQVFLEH